MSYVYGSDTLFSDKVDLSDPAVPAINKLVSADVNSIKTYLNELRDAFRFGQGVGFTGQASAPVVTSMSTFLWVNTSNLLKFHYGGNDYNIPLGNTTAKGDLLVYNGSAWSVVPLGTNNFVLTADSTTGSGVKWAAGGGGSSFYQTVQINAVDQTQRDKLNFSSLFSASDSASPSRTTITLASPTLSTWYANGTGTSSSTFNLDATRGGLLIKDNGTPISGSLLAVQNAGGPTVTFLDIGATQTQVLLSGMADGASAVAVQTDTKTTWSNATAKLLRVANANAEKFAVYASGNYNSSTDDFFWDSANKRLMIGQPAAGTGRMTLSGTNGSTSQMRITNSAGGPSDLLMGAADTPAGAFIGSLSNHPLYLRQQNNNIVTVNAASVTPYTHLLADLGTTSIRWAATYLGNDTVGTTVGSAGLSLKNATAATVGAQKYSPAITLEGQGWKTNATAASQSVVFALQNIPVQGAASPTGGLSIQRNVNGGGYTELMNIGGSDNIVMNQSLNMGVNANIVGGGGTSAADFSSGSGVFKTTTGAATYGGSSNTFTNSITVTGSPVALVRGNASETQLTGTSATDILDYTTAAAGNFMVACYYRVVTGTTNVGIDLTFTDQTGAQTQVLVPAATSTAVGSYSITPVYINAANATHIKVTATAGTANRVYVSATIMGF